MLVPVPIGLFIFSLVADLVFHFGWGEAVWAMVAFYTMAGGIVGALLAAVPGMVDLLTITDRQLKRVAVTHMGLNLLLVALYLVNFILRWRSVAPEEAPITLSLAGVIVMGFSGWLGGHMVYVHGVAVGGEEPAPGEPSLRRDAHGRPITGH
jgi:uncharacterized membrane protein